MPRSRSPAQPTPSAARCAPLRGLGRVVAQIRGVVVAVQHDTARGQIQSMPEHDGAKSDRQRDQRRGQCDVCPGRGGGPAAGAAGSPTMPDRRRRAPRRGMETPPRDGRGPGRRSGPAWRRCRRRARRSTMAQRIEVRGRAHRPARCPGPKVKSSQAIRNRTGSGKERESGALSRGPDARPEQRSGQQPSRGRKPKSHWLCEESGFSRQRDPPMSRARSIIPLCSGASGAGLLLRVQ